MDAQIDQARIESLGPAKIIIDTLTSMTDHMVHNRPGLVSRTATGVGAKWEQATWVQEGDEKVVYTVTQEDRRTKKGVKKVQVKTRAGVLQEDGRVLNGDVMMGEYRKPNDLRKLFPEIAVYLYSQVAEVYKMDEEFVARWASYAFKQANRDLKVILSAFLFVQPRAGVAEVENGEVLYYDDDYREVAEAMFLIRGRGNMEMEPKLLVRVGDVLRLPSIVEINRQLGFVNSARKVPMGRYPKAVTKWLLYREQNPAMLKGLVDAGMGGVVKALARRVHYKPQSDLFFKTLGWDQKVRHGHRTIAIGEKLGLDKESWNDLSEKEVCEKIIAERPRYKRLIGLYSGGWTPAILAACMEAGSFSDTDYILLAPTFEKFGLTMREPFKSRIETAIAKAADNQRAAKVARNAKTKQVREALEAAADKATAKAMEKATRGLRVMCMVDKSSSMQLALEKAVSYLTKFLGGFPLDRLHVSVFNERGREVKIKSQHAKAVAAAFSKHDAGGMTSYGAGLIPHQHVKVGEDEDLLMLWVGDQAGESAADLVRVIRALNMNPVAFGFLKVAGNMENHARRVRTVEAAAEMLRIPCFRLDEDMFTADDPYAITRILHDLIANTPVGAGARRAAPQKRRVQLIEQILQTPLLERPVWAA